MTAALYERMWSHDAYRHVAPGEHLAYRFVEVAKPDGMVIDFGAGTGRGARLIGALSGKRVHMLDFAENCLDQEVRDLLDTDVDGWNDHREPQFSFEVCDLRQPIAARAEFGFCTDVLEHIAPEDIDKVLLNILTAARRVFFSISTVPDHFGPAVAGEPLHLTVQPFAWWRAKLEDELKCRIFWEHDAGEAAMFFVTAYASAQDIADKSEMNAADERLRENIRANLALGLQEIAPHAPQPDTMICLLAGGPSLADHEQEIIERGRAGALFVTVNGTYNWLLARGIKPAAHIMIDARAFNARFVEREVDTCKYLISSQCAHEAVAKLPKERTWLWHGGGNELLRSVFDEWCTEHGSAREWWPVFGGSTVIGRGLVLLAMLGFRKFEVFGWDSCLRGNEHHAYAQPENDSKHVFDVTVGARTFKCHAWMAVQAQEVPALVKHIFAHIEGFEMVVRGDGLIAALLQHAAEQADKE